MERKPARNSQLVYQSSCLELSFESTHFPSRPATTCNSASVMTHLFDFLIKNEVTQAQEHSSSIAAVLSPVKGATRLDNSNGGRGICLEKDSVLWYSNLDKDMGSI